jgi:hypothetical protein
MAGAGARRAAWNLALMQDGLAPAYARLLVEMSAELGPTEALFRWLDDCVIAWHLSSCGLCLFQL